MTKLYPESGVELTAFTARNYDMLMNVISFGQYGKFISRVIRDMGIQPADSIIDLGCGTGRNAALMLKYLGESGRITGIDLSPVMKEQFENRFREENRVTFLQQRIDIPFASEEKADIVFISFVLHGFPQDVRYTILENVRRLLKPGGVFAILDYAEFDLHKIPALHRRIFKKFECPYAFDFIEKDWKEILKGLGFQTESENFYLKKYMRLLRAVAS